MRILIVEDDEVGRAEPRAHAEVRALPLNSPEPLRSIEMLAKRFDPEVLVGAGTVRRTSIGCARPAGGSSSCHMATPP